MNSRTDIETRQGQIGVDFSMQTFQRSGDARSAPINITKVLVDRIEVGKRKRKTDDSTVAALQADIRAIGLLQPIGLRRQKDSPDYDLIWGLHRFLAFKRGWENAQRLLAERGDRDQEALDEAKLWQQVPAVVHDWMPNADAEMKEISENLHRKELSPNEAKIQRARYVLLLKKLGEVIPADEKRSDNASNQYSGKKKEGGESDLRHPPKETATEKAAKDLGVTSTTIRNDFQAVSKMASAVARETDAPPVKVTPESPAEKIEEAVELAKLASDEKVPVTKTEAHMTIVRVDVTDPKQLLAWFRERLDDARKPMTIAYLRELHRGISQLIDEATGRIR
jgi:hypothetical protein